VEYGFLQLLNINLLNTNKITNLHAPFLNLFYYLSTIYIIYETLKKVKPIFTKHALIWSSMITMTLKNNSRKYYLEIMKIRNIIFLILVIIMIACSAKEKRPALVSENKNAYSPTSLAETPPMGWNSFDCYGASVNEMEIKANADMMAAHLKDYGWEYIVVDYCWFYPYSGAMNNPPQNADYKPTLAMDEYGRLLPAVDKFPSAAGGKGFKPLADYVHSKGLKFGIHVMRGIPRQAVANNAPVYGTTHKAGDVADQNSVCRWLNSMYGVDCTKDGAQDYYNSIINLYAEWGVDYIKVDDISNPYSSREIEAIRTAIDKCGRNIVLSLSPGATPLDKADHVKKLANLWRISNDFWDDWGAMKEQFELCNSWSPHIGSGHWPDADMLPLGRLNRRGPGQGGERQTNFTREEQKTMMSLWCIFRSPLMIGADLMVLDNMTKSLLSNKEVLDVNQNSLNNHQLFRNGNKIAWIADVPGTQNKYIALFNIGEEELFIDVNLEEIGINADIQVRDLWNEKNLGNCKSLFTQKISPHGSGLFKISIVH
jgi:alpha-galactosidase